jgi:hypothetical protein
VDLCSKQFLMRTVRAKVDVSPLLCRYMVHARHTHMDIQTDRHGTSVVRFIQFVPNNALCET